MKSFKKILIAISVCVALFVCCGVAAVATDYKGTVEELDAIVVELEAATTATGMSGKLVEVAEYLEKSPVDPTADGYAEVMARVYARLFDCSGMKLNTATSSLTNGKYHEAYVAMYETGTLWTLIAPPEDAAGYADAGAQYDETLVAVLEALVAQIDADVEINLNTAANAPKVNRVKALLKACDMKIADTDSTLGELIADFEDLSAAHDKAVAANFAALDDKNIISDYDKSVFMSSDFNSFAVGSTSNGDTVGDTIFVANKNGTVHPMGIAEEADGNRYVYGKYTSGGNSYHYINLNGHDSSKGYVFEIDFTTLDSLPPNGVKLEAGGFDHPTAGRIFPPHYLFISGEGDIQDNKGNTLVEDAIIPGEWVSLMIVFEPIEFTYSIYVEGQYMSTQTARYTDTSKGVENYAFDITKGHFRVGTNNNVGSYAVDNLSFYSGTNYRDVNKFEQMSDDELFVFYTNYFMDDEKDLNGRNFSYEQASDRIGGYAEYNAETGEYTYVGAAVDNAELKAAVDNYYAFDLELLLQNVRLDNLDKYKTMIENVYTMVRSTENIGERITLIGEIDEFYATYNDLINKDVDLDGDNVIDFNQYTILLSEVKSWLDYDDSAVYFVRYITRYQMVTSVSALQRYYDRADELVKSGKIDMNIITDENHPARENFTELIESYEIYVKAEEYIRQLVKNETAKKIVICMGHLMPYTTEEEWLANEELMNKYINIIKDDVYGVDYDGTPLYNPAYKGVGEAVDFFHTVHDFFYALLQDSHVEYISEVLEKISNTEAYIEKIGMVSMIERYVESSDVNYEDARIVSLLNDLDTCRAELELREQDYANLLIQNAVYFVNYVEYMRTSLTYSEQKKYFDMAYEMYFNMDITVEGARNAAAIFDEYTVRFEIIEKASAAFIEAVALYQACETEDDRYAALVDCYYNAQYVEADYPGVAEAMQTYQAAYDAYMGYANAVNAEVVACGNAVGSLRSNCGITEVIAIIIKKVFGV